MQFLWRESCNFKIARGIFHRIPLGSVARTSMKKIYTAVLAKLDIRQLKQRRRRRRGRRLVKNEFIFFYLRILQLSRSVQYANVQKRVRVKYAMTAFNSKWKCQKLAVVVRVPRTTQNLVISRSCFPEDGKEMYKDL